MGVKPKVEKKETKKTTEKEIKKIDMKDIMDGLGIEVDDIVCVRAVGVRHYLKCNSKYDLVKICDKGDKYDEKVPNLILGMVSGKHSYDVYSIKHSVLQGVEKCLNS